MKKSMRIKASGHVIERKIIDKLINLIMRADGGDLRELVIRIPTIATGVCEQSASTITFYLVHEEDKLEGLYRKVIDLLQEDEFVIMDTDMQSGGDRE